MIRISAAVLLSVAALVWVGVARGDDKAEARRHFEAGLALFKAEKYEAAAGELELSAKLYPSKGGLFNLASVYKVLSRYDEALAAMDRLEREQGERLGAEMREGVARMRREIEVLVAHLELEVEPAGALVAVDGREVGTAPLGKAVLVDPGAHEVRATLDGYRPAEGAARLVSGQKGRVRLVLERDPAAVGSVPAPAAPTPAGPDPSPLPPSPRGKGESADREGASVPSTSFIDRGPTSPRVGEGPGEGSGLHRAWFWGMLGATAVLGGVTIGMAAATDKALEDVPDQAEKDRVEGMQAGGIAILALTGAAAVTTVVLAFFTDWDGEKEPPAPVAWATDDGAGVGITGRF
jgi:hypothetical protein